MSYTINKTDGTVLTTILDGTTNTDTGLTLIGRNYTGYGTVQNENFVRLLENFADTVPPSQSLSAFTPLAGQLWWDTANKVLQVYNGADFYPVKGSVSAPMAPTALNVGDTWWDTVNQQLNIWNGTAWYVIGPSQPAGAAKSGVFTEKLQDSLGVYHDILTTYIGGNVVSIFSNDSITYTINNSVIITALGGITTIKPGLNISATSTIHGTADNSITVGGLLPSQLARVDVKSTFASGATINGLLTFNNANIFSDGTTLTFTNTNYGAGTAFYNNTSGAGATRTLNIDGTTGLITVVGNPVTDLGVATKGYVDTASQNLTGTLSTSIATTNATVAQLRTDAFANINSVAAQANSNLISNINAVNTNIISNIAAVNSAINSINSTASGTAASISALSGQLIANVALLQSGINGANVAIVTANSAVVSYVNTLVQQLTTEILSVASAAASATSAQGSSLSSQFSAVYSAIAANVTTLNSSITTSTNAATTANTRMKSYVDASNVALSNWVSAQLGPLATGLGGISLTGLAPLASPTFTGTVSAPAPDTHSTEQVATTGWVDREITSKVGSATVGIPNIFIQSTPPNNGTGNDGDIWLQVG